MVLDPETLDKVRAASPRDIAYILQQLGLDGSISAWLAQPDVTIYNALPAPAGTYQSAWFDFCNLKRASIRIVNTTGQAAIIQLIGNGAQSVEVPVRATATDMLAPVVCPAGGSISIGIGTNDDWQPYVGVLITTVIAPVGGAVTVTVSSQK